MSRSDDLTEQAVLKLRAAMSEVETRRLVIVYDPTLDPSLWEEVERLQLPTFKVQLHSITQSQGPVLIEIPDELRYEVFVNSSLRKAVDEAVGPAPWDARVRSICAWLVTERKLVDLATELSARARFRDGAGALRVYRVWDPRTMQHASELSGNGSACSCLTYTCWGLIDSFGQWNYLPAPREDAGWVIRQDQKMRLLSIANASLQRLSINGQSSSPIIWARLKQAIQVGVQSGITDEDDLSRFAADRVRWAAPIEKAVAFVDLLPIVSQGKARYSRAVADYDDQDWKDAIGSIPVTEQLNGEMQ